VRQRRPGYDRPKKVKRMDFFKMAVEPQTRYQRRVNIGREGGATQGKDRKRQNLSKREGGADRVSGKKSFKRAGVVLH